MRYLGHTIIFLGLLASLDAVPNRSKRQSETSPDCECVLRYRCTEAGTINDDGAGIIGQRITECLSNAYVCCKKPVLQIGCGWRKDVSTRILGPQQNEAAFAEFPWMLTLIERKLTTMTDVYVGGGSLIHPRAVLTAAHKLNGKISADLIVRAGDWDTQTQREAISYQESKVEAIIRHDNFDALNLRNDFAILILETPFETAPNVNSVCLPQESESFDAQNCIATGWGKDGFDKAGKYQTILKKVELPVVPHAYCENSLRLTRLGQYFKLHNSFICAGGKLGLDTCVGDGGSPLICEVKGSPGRYVQAGIVAWGIGCGADRTPGVYANVAKARSWIDRQLAQYNIGNSTYVV